VEEGNGFVIVVLPGLVFKKIPALTAPPPPKTGISLPGCYASHLADCSPKISLEHHISKSLPDVLNFDNDLRVSGPKWQEGEEKKLPPNALTSKILCKRHNSALSVLDEQSERFLTHLTKPMQMGATANSCTCSTASTWSVGF
jgi:hypothetical protein